MYKVVFYETETGAEPALAFLEELDPKLKAKALGQIELLSEKGPSLRIPFSRHLEDGIFELRVTQGGFRARILYFFVVGHTIVLTHGFLKKTQRTPRREIVRAQRARKDWRRRHD